MVPSIENAPSVTMIFCTAPAAMASFNFASKSSMELCSYRYLIDFVSLTPSIIDAWFKESEIIASFSPNKGSKTPPFASNAAAYNMVSSVPKKVEIFSSNVL